MDPPAMQPIENLHNPPQWTGLPPSSRLNSCAVYNPASQHLDKGRSQCSQHGWILKCWLWYVKCSFVYPGDRRYPPIWGSTRQASPTGSKCWKNEWTFISHRYGWVSPRKLGRTQTRNPIVFYWGLHYHTESKNQPSESQRDLRYHDMGRSVY